MKPELSDYAATLQFISSLIWPALIFVLVWRFRTQIEKLLLDLASVEVAGSKIVFQKASDKAEKPSPIAKEAILELPPDSFVPVSGIRTIVERSGLLDNHDAVIGHLLIFQTPVQHTWLVATRQNVFVVLDDAGTRRSAQLIQAVIPRDEVLPIKTDTEDGVGIFCFKGGDNWWYYSKELFPSAKSLKESIKDIIGANA